jgi:hypothetical protein
MTMKKIKLLAVLNAIVFLVHVVISYSTQFKLINNKDVGEVSNNYSSLFTPAPITFAIWGVIYFSLLCFSVYHLIMAWKRPEEDAANGDIQRIGFWFIINNLATAAWLIAWTNERLGLSVSLIFIQLISLMIINTRLPVYDRSRETASKIFTQFPLSIYFAWLTIATIANVSSYLAARDWSAGITDITWTVIMISVAVLITIAVIILRKNVFYGMVVIWALYGIIQKRQIENSGSNAGIPEKIIVDVALTGIVIVAITCLLQLTWNYRTAKVDAIKLKHIV